MEAGALAPYEHALRTAGTLSLHAEDGRLIELDVGRWLGGADHADGTVLDRCSGPVLDVGCGPGRFVSAASERGIAALGVDIAETAVARTRGQGFPALLRSIFADLPGEGRWSTILLIDGNIGIGGDPLRLLTRIHGLLGASGKLLVEADPDPDANELFEVRFSEHGMPVGPVFDWAEVGRHALERYALSVGYSLGECWVSSGRTFLTLLPSRPRYPL
jgi:SAM-dependent methyltransferase